MNINLSKVLPIIFNTGYLAPRRTLIKTIFATAENDKQLSLLEDIINYLLLAHSGQYRKGDKYFNPNNKNENLKYLSHLYMVWVQGYLSGKPLDQLIALLLHDAVEDGVKNFHPSFAKTREIIRQDIITICDDFFIGFGNDVIEHIDCLTNKQGLKFKDKHDWQLNHFKNLPIDDQNNKLYDKVANMWDTVHNPPVCWTKEKKQKDIDFAFKLVDSALCPPHHIKPMLVYLKEKL